MKNRIIKIVLIVCLIVIALDQGTKFLVSSFFKDGFGNENLGFVLTKNTGMAFGFNGGNIKNIILTIFVLLIIISFIKNKGSELDNKTLASVALAVGGGFSNLIDRIFRGRSFRFY